MRFLFFYFLFLKHLFSFFAIIIQNVTNNKLDKIPRNSKIIYH